MDHADGSLIDWEVNNLYAPTPSRGMALYFGWLCDRSRRMEGRSGQDCARTRTHFAGVDDRMMTEANQFLTRKYRAPYVLPEKV
jgi:hypothetical protein